MTKYDDASWHFGGQFPKDLPEEAGGTHIGMFVAWAVLAGLGCEDIYDEESGGAEFVKQLRERSMTPGAFAFVLDGKFTDEDLNEEGNAFAREYYDDTDEGTGKYAEDYEATVGEGLSDLYYVPDTWATFDRLKPVLDRRFAEWQASRRS